MMLQEEGQGPEMSAKNSFYLKELAGSVILIIYKIYAVYCGRD